MKYTLLSTFTPRVAADVTLGADHFLLPAHVRITADSFIGWLNAAFAPALVASRVAGVVTLAWDGAGTLDLGNADLAEFLGFDNQAIPHTQAAAESPIAGYLECEVAEPWGGRTRETFRDVPGFRGRTTASEAGEETAGAIGLWLHRRGDTATFAVAVAAAYAAADAWVRAELEVITQDADSLVFTLADGWEFAPEQLDAESATVRLEVIRWQ